MARLPTSTDTRDEHGMNVAPAQTESRASWRAFLVGLGIIVVVRLLINTTLPMEDRLDVQLLETILAAIVGFYFGARS